MKQEAEKLFQELSNFIFDYSGELDREDKLYLRKALVSLYKIINAPK